MSSRTSEKPEVPRGPVTMLVSVIEKAVLGIGKTVSWLNIILMLIILVQVILRYLFNLGSVALEELQWHLYAVGIMTGLSYAMTEDTHVRLDLLHARLRRKTRAWIDIIGILVLVLPWCYVIIHHGMDFVAASWRVKEASASPTGLPCYYIIKSVIPVSFGLLVLAAVARLLRMCLVIAGKGGAHDA